ncbi:MAG: hypothetical protein COB51_13465 [Moraxellaceae bacterium]|nr:MAG: hypothetical protein COB51_13465 [Moraxellaceae bacterium]
MLILSGKKEQRVDSIRYCYIGMDSRLRGNDGECGNDGEAKTRLVVRVVIEGFSQSFDVLLLKPRVEQ